MGSSEASGRRLLSAECAERAIAERTGEVDGVVRSSFSRHLTPAFPQGLAALAVGGFGRRELFPHSDVDVLVLTREGIRASAVREPVGRFLQELWDAGLRLSHSVHTIEECCQIYEHNVELSVSLLDRRTLIGDAQLLEQMETALAAFFRIHGRAVARRLAALTRLRHAKFNNSIFHLEPNIKETPGALRDLQSIRWLSRLLAADSPSDLDGAWRFLAPLRVFLHAGTTMFCRSRCRMPSPANPPK